MYFWDLAINYRPQRSWGKVLFLHVSVILFTGGVSRPTPRGEVEGSGRGVSPGPYPGGGCIPACNEADTPLSRRLLLRAVLILLECILVLVCYPFTHEDGAGYVARECTASAIRLNIHILQSNNTFVFPQNVTVFTFGSKGPQITTLKQQIVGNFLEIVRTTKRLQDPNYDMPLKSKIVTRKNASNRETNCTIHLCMIYFTTSL